MMDGTLTAFGEAQVAEKTLITGWTFAYNINPDMVTTASAQSSGAADVDIAAHWVDLF